jgi:hypothetical protein
MIIIWRYNYGRMWEQGDGLVFVRYLLLMRLNSESEAIFSVPTAKQLADELIAYLQRLEG